MEDTEKKTEPSSEPKSESSNGGSNKKVFSMVGGICALVAAGMAVVYAIYYIVYGIQAFGASYDHHVITGIFDLLITVCFAAFALFGVLSGLKLLAGSKASGSGHDAFSNFFFIESIVMIVFVALIFTTALFQGWDNNYWIPYLIVNASFYVASIILMLISKSKSGIVAPILFFVGIACFMIATSYEIGGWWVSALFAVALYGVEAMAVLSAIFEDKCFSKK
jgi:magnesium-transporting ATPase (P-type)